MNLDLTNRAQCSRLIDETESAINKLFALMADLTRYTAVNSINNASSVLSQGGSVFPPGIYLSPAEVEAARSSLTALLTLLTTNLSAQHQLNFDRIRYNLGVLTGTG